MNKEVSSKILDDAREAVIDELARWDYTSQRDERERANSVLALSGSTDIECPDCEGYRSTFSEFCCESYMDCPTCGNASFIPYKWKVSVVLENGVVE